MSKSRKARINKKLSKKQMPANNASRTGSNLMNMRSGTYHNTNSKRNLWEVGGLPDELQFDDLYNMYRRNGMAKAGVMKPIERCWRTTPIISDGEYDENEVRDKTAFEQDVETLISDFDLFERLIGLDNRQRIGRYGGIIVIAKENPATNPSSTKQLKAQGIKSLVKLMPVFESQIQVSENIDDITSEDFGNPKFYQYQSNAIGSRSNVSKSVNFHPSRVFAFGEGADDGTIYGKSALEAPFNALSDWEKIRISAAEGYYKNAKQRIALSIKDTETANAFYTPEAEDALNKSLNDFGKGWDSTLLLGGMDVMALQSSIMDPTGPASMCLQEVCAGFNIPKTAFTGFETGERSSTENSRGFDEDMMTRREGTLTKMIEGLLWHLINANVISAPENGKICVEWDDLLASSDSEKLENAQKLVTMNQGAFSSGMTPVFTTEEIREAAGFGSEEEDEEYDEMIDDDMLSETGSEPVVPGDESDAIEE